MVGYIHTLFTQNNIIKFVRLALDPHLLVLYIYDLMYKFVIFLFNQTFSVHYRSSLNGSLRKEINGLYCH